MYTINEFALESERFDDFEAELKSKILSLIFFFSFVCSLLLVVYVFVLLLEKASIWLVSSFFC